MEECSLEKPLKFKQIFMPYPNSENRYTYYDKKLQPKMEFKPAALEAFFFKHKEELIEMTIKACENYLDEEDWMAEETFPRVQDLTGQWYLAFVSVKQEEDNKIAVVLYIHFLGYYPRGCAKKEIDDYLGMEAMFYYDPIKKTFLFDGFNTDSI